LFMIKRAAWAGEWADAAGLAEPLLVPCPCPGWSEEMKKRGMDHLFAITGEWYVLKKSETEIEGVAAPNFLPQGL